MGTVKFWRRFLGEYSVVCAVMGCIFYYLGLEREAYGCWIISLATPAVCLLVSPKLRGFNVKHD